MALHAPSRPLPWAVLFFSLVATVAATWGVHGAHRHQNLSDLSELLYVFGSGVLLSLALFGISHTQARARTAAESSQARLLLLSELTGPLGATLEFHAGLREMARLPVPRFADACAIDLFGVDGELARLALHPPEARLAEPRDQPLHTDTTLRLPVTVHDRRLGFISFELTGARRFMRADRLLAEEFAGRAAVALENARLHRQARAAELAAETQRSRFHALFMQAPVAIAIQEGPEHIYRLANPNYRQFLGNRELIGLRRRDVLPDFARLSKILDEVYASGQPWDGREQVFKVDRGDGEWVEGYFNLICQPILEAEGRVGGVITFGFEVTDLVLARKDKEALAGHLEAAVRARDTFLAVASHELRTPLTTLQLLSDGMMRSIEQGKLDPDKTRHRVERIQGQAQRLNRLVGDLLDVSRITAGRLVLQPEGIDLRALAQEVMTRIEDALTRAGCTVELLPGDAVTGRWDRGRIDQVLVNLLSNAAKYGAGAPIEIRVEAEGSTARVTVRDRGIGIAPEDQGRIFERFERAVSERNFGGLGLGLWISKQIVEAHGGTIRVESRPHEGSQFIVELPRGV